MRPRISIRGFVRPSVRWLVGWSVVIELESVKTHISAPAHPSATGIGRVSGLVVNQGDPISLDSSFLSSVTVT